MQQRGFVLGRVLGIEIRLDPSLLIIFLLIVVSLAIGVFPSWHPDWSAFTSWWVSTLAGILFLLSVLLHELAHAVVARGYGLPVRTITLFLFGGVANVEEEPERPGIEFFMAVVGPLTSIALGVIFLVLGGLLAGPIDAATDPAQFAASLGPIPTLLAWLGPVNLLLGVFNLLPGFPLDGGRMLRAAVWKATGDLVRATRWASRAGMAIGWMLVAAGIGMAFGLVIPGLGTGLVSGLWLALIGWFLSRLAAWGYQRTVLEHVLDRVHVGEVMARHLLTVPPDLSVAEFIRDHLQEHDQLSWPVMRGDVLAGVVRAEDVERIPRDRRATMRLSEVMIPADRVPVSHPDDTATDALRKLGQGTADHVAVEQDGRLLGVVRQLDIMRWLRLNAGEPTAV